MKKALAIVGGLAMAAASAFGFAPFDASTHLDNREADLKEMPADNQETKARLQAVVDLRDILTAHPDDFGTHVMGEYEMLKSVAEQDGGNRLLWARLGEYAEVAEKVK